MVSIKKIAVVGAGTMGNGIAHTFAQHGFETILIDQNPNQLNSAKSLISKNLERQVAKGILLEQEKISTINNITYATSINENIRDIDLVIEAVSENEEIKIAVFKQISNWAKSDALLASNTSSISISRIAESCKYPERVLGMHFMNPVPVMELVEVIKGKKTSSETIERITNLCRLINKTPVNANDFPGFVANRILMPMINEAIISLEQGVAGVLEIDQIMKLGMAHPMGPLELADFIGLDVCLSIMKVLESGLKSTKYQPANLLVQLVNSGDLGKKSGCGFYQYENNSKDKRVAHKFATLS